MQSTREESATVFAIDYDGSLQNERFNKLLYALCKKHIFLLDYLVETPPFVREEDFPALKAINIEDILVSIDTLDISDVKKRINSKTELALMALLNFISPNILKRLFIKSNEPLLHHIATKVESEKPDHVVLLLGTNRQSFVCDLMGIQQVHRGKSGEKPMIGLTSGTAYFDFPLFRTAIEERIKHPCLFIPFTLSDIYTEGLNIGDNFRKILNYYGASSLDEADLDKARQGNRYLQLVHLYKECCLRESLDEGLHKILYESPFFVYDEPKLTLMYALSQFAQINLPMFLKTASDGLNVNLHFIDDNIPKIIQPLHHFLSDHPELLVTKTALHMTHYQHGIVGETFSAIEGRGERDKDYFKSIIEMARTCAKVPTLNRSISIDGVSQLDVPRFLANRQKRLLAKADRVSALALPHLSITSVKATNSQEQDVTKGLSPANS